MNPAVFLDRDGTLIEDAGYLDRVERLRLFPWSIDAVRLLNQAGFRVLMVTNQAGVAQGMFDESVVHGLHAHIGEIFAAGGARIHGWYYCPHHPHASAAAYRIACECRKPGPGMVRQAERDHALDLARSFVIGDRWLDVELGTRLGMRGVLVRTGYGATEERRQPQGVAAAAVATNLIEAVAWILGQPQPTLRTADAV
jgi:D-glycero-D-manno-heptose 1,7-bisphosphate phosphatase